MPHYVRNAAGALFLHGLHLRVLLLFLIAHDKQVNKGRYGLLHMSPVLHGLSESLPCFRTRSQEHIRTSVPEISRLCFLSVLLPDLCVMLLRLSHCRACACSLYIRAYLQPLAFPAFGVCQSSLCPQVRLLNVIRVSSAVFVLEFTTCIRQSCLPPQPLLAGQT